MCETEKIKFHANQQQQLTWEHTGEKKNNIEKNASEKKQRRKRWATLLFLE